MAFVPVPLRGLYDTKGGTVQVLNRTGEGTNTTPISRTTVTDEWGQTTVRWWKKIGSVGQYISRWGERFDVNPTYERIDPETDEWAADDGQSNEGIRTGLEDNVKNDVKSTAVGWVGSIRVDAAPGNHYTPGLNDFTFESWVYVTNPHPHRANGVFNWPANSSYQLLRTFPSSDLFETQGTEFAIGLLESSVAESGEQGSIHAYTTSNVSLSGLITIGGRQLQHNDFVLVRAQTQAWQNGMYKAREGAWAKEPLYYTNSQYNGAVPRTVSDIYFARMRVFVNQPTASSSSQFYHVLEQTNASYVSAMWSVTNTGVALTAQPGASLSGYHENYPLFGGSGTGAKCSFFAAAPGGSPSAVMSFQLDTLPPGYQVGDVLTVNPWGYQIQITRVPTNLTFERVLAGYAAPQLDPIVYPSGQRQYRLTFKNMPWCTRADSRRRDFVASSLSFPENTWAHVALVRSGATMRVFINGQISDEWPIPANYSIDDFTPGRQGTFAYITGKNTDGYPMNRTRFSDLALHVGIAKYTSPFTPPTEPIQTLPQTRLHLRYSDPALGEIMQLYSNGQFVANINRLDVSGSDLVATASGTTGYLVGSGVKWVGQWQSGTQYKANEAVKNDNAFFIAKNTHTASSINEPHNSKFEGPTTWPDNWDLVLEQGEAELNEEESSFLSSLMDGFFDWLNKPWTIGDWLLGILGAAGIIYAGSQILDAFNSSPSSGVDEDARYNGSPSFTGAYTPPSLRDVVSSLCGEAGLFPSEYDVSLLSNTTRVHFTLTQTTTVRAVLDLLSKAYQFDMVDSMGVLKFVPRTLNVVRQFSNTDLGFNASNEIVAPVVMKRLQSIDLPRSVSLTYQTEDLDYNNFTQKTEIPSFTNGNDITLSVPFLMTHEQAKETTEKLIIGAHLERMQYAFKVSYPQAIDLEPGDIVQIPGATVRIVQLEEIEEGVIEINGVDAGAFGLPEPVFSGSDIVGYTASSNIGTGQEPILPPPVLNPAPVIYKTEAFFIDPPVMSNTDKNPRVFVAAHANGGIGWTGATIHVSTDNGASYTQVDSTNKEATWGLVENALPPFYQYFTWDDTTVITVKLKTGQLLSATDTAVYNGANRCMIGREVIAFGHATLVAPNTYQISHLLRGRSGTEYVCTGTIPHEQNELFVLLDDALTPIEVDNSSRGTTFLVKVVTNGASLANTDAKQVQIIGENTVPWTVVREHATKTGNNWNLTWVERPRWNNSLRDYGELAHDPDWNGWVVTMFNNADQPVRTSVVYSPTFEYTSAMQIADFGTNQNSVRFRIAAASTLYGGGRQVLYQI